MHQLGSFFGLLESVEDVAGVGIKVVRVKDQPLRPTRFFFCFFLCTLHNIQLTPQKLSAWRKNHPGAPGAGVWPEDQKFFFFSPLISYNSHSYFFVPAGWLLRSSRVGRKRCWHGWPGVGWPPRHRRELPSNASRRHRLLRNGVCADRSILSRACKPTSA